MRIPQVTHWLAILLATVLSVPALGSESPQQEVERFVEQMVSRHGLERDQLHSLLARGKVRQEIIDSFEKSAERTWAWKKYRKNFLNESRITKGVKFWNKHLSLFEAASKQFHIPQHILVAIVGVETHYGNRTGKTPVLDSLITQAFHYPERARFGRKELEAFLLLGRDEGIDLAAVKAPTLVPSANPSLSPPATAATPSTSMAMAGATCGTVMPTLSVASQTTSRITAGTEERR